MNKLFILIEKITSNIGSIAYIAISHSNFRDYSLESSIITNCSHFIISLITLYTFLVNRSKNSSNKKH